MFDTGRQSWRMLVELDDNGKQSWSILVELEDTGRVG